MKYLITLLAMLICCSGFLFSDHEKDNHLPEGKWKMQLSDYNLFVGRLNEMQPAEGVMPYELNSPLFSDYASKARFIYLPEGEKVNYNEKLVLDFPKGTIISKTFYYPIDPPNRKKETPC